MSDEKTYIRFEEEKAIVAMIDRIADAEGTTRAAIARRLIRRGLGFSLPTIPENEHCPQTSSGQPA